MPYLQTFGGNLNFKQFRFQENYVRMPKSGGELEITKTADKIEETGGSLSTIVNSGINLMKENPALISSIATTGSKVSDAFNAVKEINNHQAEMKKLKSIKQTIKNKNNKTATLSESQIDELKNLTGSGFSRF